MTPERFVHLADAYGADLKHWPAAEREDARALIKRGDPQAINALQQASWLDRRLDNHPVAAPDQLLIREVVASAFTVEKASFWSRYADWLSRLGFLGAGLAGVAAGMLVASLSLPLSSAPDLLPSILDQGDAELMLSLDAEESEQ
ncbi:hypothetical protein [Pseudomonas abietaniphila]|jgi:hypothetical protein